MDSRPVPTWVWAACCAAGAVAAWSLIEGERRMRRLDREGDALRKRFEEQRQQPATFIHSSDWKRVHDELREPDPAPGYLPFGYALCPICWPEYEGWTPEARRV